jgi:GalNAc-alpha-(1->4)-GalNAc-alpha-(1->3)-diNAcBac-PP-undecaprenol alpha-1,4-N-acetyl-D-galactosaminyltransferase
MKIMMLVSSMHAGGAERVAATLVNGWSARGDSVTLVPTYSSKGSCFYAVSDAVDLVWLADRVGARRSGVFAAWGRLRALRALVREKSPDVIVSFLTNVNVAAILATWAMPVPLIVCERTDPTVPTTVTPLWRRLRRFFYPYADMVTVQTASALGPFSRQVPAMKRLAVIPNPLSPELSGLPIFDRASIDVSVNSESQPRRKRLSAMGRFAAEKQFGLLIDMFAGLASDAPQWDLWIWGDGPLRVALQAHVDALGLHHRVVLPGRTDAPWQALAESDAFVLSSAVEGFPNVLLEAMALGLACVAFDCPSGPREITRNGEDALLVPNGDVAALHDAVKRVVSDAAFARDLGARGAASVRKRYALATILAQWDALFAQLGVPTDTPFEQISSSTLRPDNVRQGTQ